MEEVLDYNYLILIYKFFRRRILQKGAIESKEDGDGEGEDKGQTEKCSKS